MPRTANIRARQPSDLDGCVAALWQTHLRDRYPLAWPTDPKAWLTGSRQLRAWVAEDDGAICGHVAITRPAPGEAATAWANELAVVVEALVCVSQLFVAPHARGDGLGGRLLDVALGEIRSMGAAAALEVISPNADAMALYRRHGWREIGFVRYSWLPDPERSLLYIGPTAD